MINKAILVGRLTADPELKQTPSGISVTRFSVACDRPYSSNGERKADFINCIAWRQNAEFISKYFRKGNAIGIDGSIQTDNYTDKNGNKRYTTEVLVDRASFVESKSAAAQSVGGGSGYQSAPASKQEPAQQEVSYQSGSFDDFQDLENDDDLPF